MKANGLQQAGWLTRFALAAIKILSQTKGVDVLVDNPLADQIELAYLDRPNALKRKVLLYAILGHFVLWGAVLLIFSCLVGLDFLLIYLQDYNAREVNFLVVECLVILLVGIPLKKLYWYWYGKRKQQDEGYELTRKAFPALFAHLDGVSARMKAPRVDRIRIVYFCGAYAREVDLLLGTTKQIGIGIPFFEALSVPEITSIFAHELGHLKGGHCRFLVWYLLKWRWKGMTRDGSWTFIPRFWKWYWPLFDGHQLALERLNERYADRLSAEVVGGNVMSSALVRTRWSAYLGYRYLNENSTTEKPTLQGLIDSFQQTISREPFDENMKQELLKSRDEPRYVSFKERISLYSPQFDPFSVSFPQPEPTAASVFLKDKLPQIYPVLEKEFHEARMVVTQKTKQQWESNPL